MSSAAISQSPNILILNMVSNRTGLLHQQFSRNSADCPCCDCVHSALSQLNPPTYDEALKLHQKVITVLKGIVEQPSELTSEDSPSSSSPGFSETVAKVQKEAHALLALNCLKAGSCLIHLESYTEAAQYIKEGLDQLKKSEKDYSILSYDLNYKMGFVLTHLKNFDRAYDYANKAYQIAQNDIQPTNHLLLSNSCYLLGNVLERLGMLNDALKYRIQAVEAISPYVPKDSSKLRVCELKLSDCLRKIGFAFYEAKNNQEAENYIRRALQIKDRIKVKGDILSGISCKIRLGTTLRNLERYSEALFYLGTAVNLIENAGVKKDIRFVRLLRVIADVFDRAGNHQTALAYRERTLDSAIETIPNDLYSLSEAHHYMSLTLVKLGKQEEAEAHQQMAEKLRIEDLLMQTPDDSERSSLYGDEKRDGFDDSLPIFINDRGSPELEESEVVSAQFRSISPLFSLPKERSPKQP